MCSVHVSSTHGMIPGVSVEPRVRFEFSLFVPGIRLLTKRGFSAPKPLGKGSLEPQKRANGSYKQTRNGTLVWGDKPEVYDWVNKIAACALQRRSQLIASGYDPFPYRGAVKVSTLFVYERPTSQRRGHPIAKTVQHDLDKLQRALGDAITPTRDPKFPMGDIIEDDKLITTWGNPRKRFIDQIRWRKVTPAAGVFFKIEEDPDDPIDIREYL